MTQEPLVGQEWLKSLKPLSEEQKQKNREEAAWIKERQQRCRAMEAEYMREFQENSEKEKRDLTSINDHRFFASKASPLSTM